MAATSSGMMKWAMVSNLASMTMAKALVLSALTTVCYVLCYSLYTLAHTVFVD